MARKARTASGQRPVRAAWPLAASGESIALRCRVTAQGRTVVRVRGHLGEASEQRAACLASQANRAFRLSGPAPALMQIVRTAGSGCALVRWPLGGRLEWVDPQAVAGSLARLDQPQAATLR